MLVQLVAVGFALRFIFAVSHPGLILGLFILMLLVATWIALRPVKALRRAHFGRAFLALCVGGGLTLAVVLGAVVPLEPWFEPRYSIPLAGMVFANAMNGLSLAAERFDREQQNGRPYREARGEALQAALLPLTNTFHAVGLVSLPGMMTGQILAGVDPLLAVRYQIVVMAMVFAAAGISAAVYLKTIKGCSSLD